ncbi:hypothetical protein QCA50_008936 [Cerrena zonata]|uniref:Uncharacterized protein n=1 Tax=Cerrena zonata TaxID=2478898 RepID=A0AAW0G2J6_9APHY
MKSCLKHTPPVTPTLSASGTPNDSRNGSPRTESLAPSIRKMVSFCEDEEGLEEVHYADDWDRSPTPMTPRLSYQDILELKQLQLTLPRAPTYRQFTTSTPHPSCLSTPGSSSSRQPFPVSRFATAQSLTPSKWKNREESQSSVDPDILPYLDAVPIQLLPLLDTAAATPVGPPVATPAPSTSPPTPKTRTVSPPYVPAQPTPPSVSSSSLDSPTSPTTTPTPSPRRTPNFTFLPLLPIEEPKPAPPPPVQKPPEPKRKINMTFLPLMPVNETQPSSNAVIADASPKTR